MLDGLLEPGCFVVNGAPQASVDLKIAKEVLTACGFTAKDDGVWAIAE